MKYIKRKKDGSFNDAQILQFDTHFMVRINERTKTETVDQYKIKIITSKLMPVEKIPAITNNLEVQGYTPWH